MAGLVAITLAVPAWGQTGVGWRTDGTGKYPTARPVAEWSPEKNVAWATTMPSWSNSSPVLPGGSSW